MGSVKTLTTISPATKTKTGYGNFDFSDDFSVFDNGKMPDQIPYKGQALCMMSAYAFEQLHYEYHGNVRSHYLGLVDQNGKTQQTTERLNQPSSIMQVKLVQVIKPTFKSGIYDYSAIKNAANYLIPLEIIYRLGLPKGSSVYKRLDSGVQKPEDIGLDHYPEFGERLPQPFFEVTTKLEKTDRQISWEVAQEISDLKDTEIIEIKKILGCVVNIINLMARKAGLQNEDGKIEVAKISSGITVVDVFGTLDECRFTKNGIQVSKEMLRQFYNPTPWKKAVDEAKIIAKEKKVEDWKQFCRLQPPLLPQEWIKVVSQAYQSTTNAVLGRQIFDSPPLDDVIEKYQKLCSILN